MVAREVQEGIWSPPLLSPALHCTSCKQEEKAQREGVGQGERGIGASGKRLHFGSGRLLDTHFIRVSYLLWIVWSISNSVYCSGPLDFFEFLRLVSVALCTDTLSVSGSAVSGVPTVLHVHINASEAGGACSEQARETGL